MIDQGQLREFVEKYLSIINSKGIEQHVEDEDYKFAVVDNFQKTFEIDDGDLYTILEASILDTNLSSGPYWWPRATLLELATERPNEVRQALVSLFDESAEVRSRIDNFCEVLNHLMEARNRERGEDKDSFADLRFASLLLSLSNPDRYFPMKTQEYKKFCKSVHDGFSVPSGLSAGEQYEVYRPYVEALAMHLANIPEIKEIQASLTGETDFKDAEYHWMAQDVIFIGASAEAQSADQSLPSEVGDIGEHSNEILRLLKSKKQIILYGPPGTGKTYSARNVALHIAENFSIIESPRELTGPDPSEPSNAPFAALQTAVKKLAGIEARARKSMVGFYMQSPRTNARKPLVWLEYPSSHKGSFTVHLRKDDERAYPQEMIQPLHNYKSSGWGGYPSFVVRDMADVSAAVKIIRYGYDYS